MDDKLGGGLMVRKGPIFGTILAANLLWTAHTFRAYVQAPDIRTEIKQYMVVSENLSQLKGGQDKTEIHEILRDSCRRLTGIRESIGRASAGCETDSSCTADFETEAQRINNVEERIRSVDGRVDSNTDGKLQEAIVDLAKTAEDSKPHGRKYTLGKWIALQILSCIGLAIAPLFIKKGAQVEEELERKMLKKRTI